jgi:probable HAF family extracellular repeat protein
LLSYTITDLGSLGGFFTFPNGLNNSGEVTGTAFLPGQFINPHAFLASDGTITDLGTLGGLFSVGAGINNRGEVAGTATLAGGEFHAFLWSKGAMSDLGTLGGPNSNAQAINDSGQVVGTSNLPGSFQAHAFLWKHGAMSDLGTLGGSFSEGNGINNAGQVVGLSGTPGDAQMHAFLESQGTMTDLGTLGGTFSDALAINNLGQVVGQSTIPGDQFFHAFLWSNGVMTDLGTLGGGLSIATAINASGVVVGQAALPDLSGGSFVFSNGSLTNLSNQLPAGTNFISLSATGINDRGQITALAGEFKGGVQETIHALLLTPITDDPISPSVAAALAGPTSTSVIPGAGSSAPSTANVSGQTAPPATVWVSGAHHLGADGTDVAGARWVATLLPQLSDRLFATLNNDDLWDWRI